MKNVPRAEMTTIKEVLYPLRKKVDHTWDRINLKDLEELKEKVNKLKEEKQKELENKPEPFKLKKFKNIPSKFMDTENWVIRKQKIYQANNPNHDNIYIKNSNEKGKEFLKINKASKSLNKSALIRKLPPILENNNKKYIIKTISSNKLSNNNSHINNIANDSKSYSSIDEIINNNINNNNEFNLEKELSKISINNNDKSPSLFSQPMSNSEEIEKLIKDYKKKYGDTEVIESLLKEYEEVKRKRVQNGQEKENEKNIIIEENQNNILNNNINYENEINYNNDYLKDYEPKDENEDYKKPPLPSIEDVPLILPKIHKNYIRENIQLITENKIPQKKYVDNSALPEKKHKNFGKVPEYIKRYEMEREYERQELLRRKEEMKYPKGTRLLSEEERVKILNALIRSQQQMSNLLEKMPVTYRAPNIQKTKDDLVKKLIEVDKAIEKFSKKRVFVKK